MSAKKDFETLTPPYLLPLDKPFLSVSKKQQFFCLSLYIVLISFAIVLINTAEHQSLKIFALGLFLPGSGFLYWAGPENPAQILHITLSVITFSGFLFSLIIWIATGNVILPLFIWFGSAIASGMEVLSSVNSDQNFVWQPAQYYIPLFCLVFLLSLFVLLKIQSYIQLNNGKQYNKNRTPKGSNPTPFKQRKPGKDELTLEDLKLMRLLLDRSLQPLNEFNGFEWSDQFQSGAIRYQLSFMSYALSIAQSVHMPAFKGYLSTAQNNLAMKQQDHRIWRYWKYENLWGNLRIGSDPIPFENIMYTGFIAAQLSYFQASNQSNDFSKPNSFSCQHPLGTNYSYSLPEIAQLLKNQYKSAKYGLLACEPNWIYPLCNFITTSALRTYDTTYGTSNWEEVEPSFRHHLETEFIRPDGQITPFRSSYTGFSIPSIGGAVMQSFPCLFLNMCFPDIAERQWEIFRAKIKNKNLKKMCWPIDVGNYKFSRASSYSATAAAAIELGDDQLACELMQLLNDDCPKQIKHNVMHRENSSLWAHAVELMVRCGQKNAFKNLATSKPSAINAPYIKQINYPQILVAKAINKKNALSLTLYPGEASGIYPLTIGNLKPGCTYTVATNKNQSFQSDKHGEVTLNIPIHGRTEVHIYPTI